MSYYPTSTDTTRAPKRKFDDFSEDEPPQLVVHPTEDVQMMDELMCLHERRMGTMVVYALDPTWMQPTAMCYAHADY
jgi:hypothetical protein